MFSFLVLLGKSGMGSTADRKQGIHPPPSSPLWCVHPPILYVTTLKLNELPVCANPILTVSGLPFL